MYLLAAVIKYFGYTVFKHLEFIKNIFCQLKLPDNYIRQQIMFKHKTVVDINGI